MNTRGRDVKRTARRRLGWIAALMLLVAGCTTALESAEIRPFSEVQDSELGFELDPTNPTRGVFRVTTTEPMICAIVWGETEAYGNFNNSLNMAGTGIEQHDVFLPGARPGVEYHFIVQGTTADGRLFRSEPGTFLLAGPETTANTLDLGPNLAQGASIVDVSSEFNEAFGAANAVDGDLSTEWSSAGDGDNAFLTLDLGRPTSISVVEFLTRSMTDGTATAETFTVVVDGGAAIGPPPAGNPADPRPASIDVTGTEFTFQVESSTGGNTGAVEIRMFG